MGPKVQNFCQQDNFYTMYMNNCGRVEGFNTATCAKIVLGGKQADAACEIHL